MRERYCALTLGILFTLLGVAGFVPSLISLPSMAAVSFAAHEHSSLYGVGYGYILGLFPTNLWHNIVHGIVGLLGIALSTSVRGARTYNRSFAIAYALLAIMGMLPSTRMMFGLMPLFNNNVWFNALTAAIAAYYSFLKPTETIDVTASSNP